MTTRPLGAQISHMLKDRGVDVIFGIPGVHNQEMYRGIEEAGITHVLARHEQGAGFMADGYARATGKPGVAYVISGPGLCNIMTPMGQAYSDSVPMLVISSVLDETEATRGQLHQMKDQEGAAATVCDWSVTARTAEAAYTLIDRAFTEFDTQRPRPKHVCVPIQRLEADSEPSPFMTSFDRRPAYKSQRDENAVTVIASALEKASYPVIVFGGGAVGMGRELSTKLARAIGAVTFMTYAARGLVDDSYPLNYGSMLARPQSQSVFAKADLVLTIGSSLSEVDLWREELGHDCRSIRVDIDAENLAAVTQSQTDSFLCDASPCFEAVLDELAGHIVSTGWSENDVRQDITKWRAEIDAERPGILPVADALKAALPSNTMIYSDMTQFAYAAKEVYPMDRPGHWHHPYGFGTLGYALPAAIGGKVGVGEKPVIAIAGDYGFQYTVQELAVAVELELTLPIIIWDNGKLGEIEDSMVRAQIAPNAVIQRNPDFLKLAEAYGAAATQPTTLAEFKQAVQTALQTKGPTVIRVISDIALTSS